MFNVQGKRLTKYQEGFKFLTKVCPSISFLFYFLNFLAQFPTLPPSNELFSLIMLMIRILFFQMRQKNWNSKAKYSKNTDSRRASNNMKSITQEREIKTNKNIEMLLVLAMNYFAKSLQCSLLPPSIKIRQLVIRARIRSNARAGKCLVTWLSKPHNFSQSSDSYNIFGTTFIISFHNILRYLPSTTILTSSHAIVLKMLWYMRDISSILNAN